MTTVKKRKRPKRTYTRWQRIEWCETNPKPRQRGRLPNMYTELPQLIDEATLDGLTLAMYQIMLGVKGQQHLRPNKRTIDLVLPHDFRSRLGRSFPMGRHIRDTEDGWFCVYRVKVCLLYDYLYDLGCIEIPRKVFTGLVYSVKMSLLDIEKTLENVVPSDVLENMNEIVKKELTDD